MNDSRRRRLLQLTAVLVLWPALHLTAVAVDGVVDDAGTYDVLVVLGNKVEVSGVPSERLRERLERALSLYREGRAPRVIVSGGLGKEGHEEAEVMARFLVARGVPRAHVIEDRQGWTTYDTARNARAIMASHGWSSALIVTTYYHVSRTKLALRRAGVPEVGGASAVFNLGWQEPYALAREFAGYYVYACRSYETD